MHTLHGACGTGQRLRQRKGLHVPQIAHWGALRDPNPQSGCNSRSTECFFSFTLVTGPRRSLILKLRDTRVYAPQIRVRLGNPIMPASSAVPRLRGVREPPWRQPRGKSMVSSVNYHTNATMIRWHLWEIDSRFAPGLPPGWQSCPPAAQCRVCVGCARRERCLGFH